MNNTERGIQKLVVIMEDGEQKEYENFDAITLSIVQTEEGDTTSVETHINGRLLDIHRGIINMVESDIFDPMIAGMVQAEREASREE